MGGLIPIEIPVTTLNAVTGEVVETGTGSAFMLPAPAGTCEMCATKHEPELPHNAGSLFYQTRYQIEHGRGADWRDAMAHCSDEMKALWTEHLERLGVDVAGGGVRPAGATV